MHNKQTDRQFMITSTILKIECFCIYKKYNEIVDSLFKVILCERKIISLKVNEEKMTCRFKKLISGMEKQDDLTITFHLLHDSTEI